MPEAGQTDRITALDTADERWHAAFAAIERDVDELHELLERELRAAESVEVYNRAHTLLEDRGREGNRVVAGLRGLLREVDELRSEWSAEHRYTREGVEELVRGLRQTISVHRVRGARAWLGALLDAADAGEEEAAVVISAADLDWPDELRPGLDRLRASFARWRDDGEPPAREPIAAVADGTLEGWRDVLTPDARSRAHRFAAWIALWRPGGTDVAQRHIEEALRLASHSARMLAERAALRLYMGDFELAAVDGQHAVELAPHEPLGHLMLGIWAELAGNFGAADDLYRRGLGMMPTVAIAGLSERSSLIDPPGRLLAAGAAVLLDRGRPELALRLCDEALLASVRGIEPHPEAAVLITKRRALERIPERAAREAADTAVDAGRLCIWNGDVDGAVTELGRAVELDSNPEAGWVLADALLTKSFPLGARGTDMELVRRAHTMWDDWTARIGLPSGPTAWAYVTRGIIADLESQQTGANRRVGLFEALIWVEKALVHNHTDAQRWGYTAQLLRYLGFEQLAFEAVANGYALSSADRFVQSERLPLLANRGEYAEAEAAADLLVTMYGEDPWISAVRAWLALHHGHDWDRALALLELPLAEGSDCAWYREMQAEAYLGLDRLDDARRAFADLLDEALPIDGNTKCRLALAGIAHGRRDDAQRWLDDAADDPTTPASSHHMIAALLAVAKGDAREATGLAERSIAEARSAVEVDDRIFETTLMLPVVGGRAEQEAALRHALETAAAARKRELERDPPTADTELEAALADIGSGELGIHDVAMLAVAACRDAASGRAEQAAQRYEQLLGSSFEPEATLALKRQRSAPST
jgi:tetratricopeptide (TPR) repeat protein